MVGPFVQYAEPGVFTRTLADSTVATLTGGLRIPLFIGVGSEDLQITDYELVRGSSNIVDNIITGEDVSSQLTGTVRDFQVMKYPIVTGNGEGIIANDANSVKVFINGNPAGVSLLDGVNGTVTLSSIPRESDTVTINYYFKRTDTLIESDDLSVQADGILVSGVIVGNKLFKTNYSPIVDGSNSGIATTDVSKVTVLVNGAEVEVAEVDGQNGVITLSETPCCTAVVVATYWTNQWQNTFDYLPVSSISEVLRVGTAPGRSDFINTLDFVIEENKIQWGNSYTIKGGNTYINSEVFDETFIQSFIIDKKVYVRPTLGTVDSINKVFKLDYIPTSGTGKGSPTNDVNKLTAYVGVGVQDALIGGPVVISRVSGNSREIELKVAPAIGQVCYVTHYHNQVSDDTFTLSVITESTPTTPGVYEVTSLNNGVVQEVVPDLPSCSVADPDFAVEGITYPLGGFDGQAIPGYAVEEQIVLNFINSTDYLVLSSIGPTGSEGSGSLGQTYIDAKTGTSFTVMPGSGVVYQAGDMLEFDVNPRFLTKATPQYSIPGMKVTIPGFNGVSAGNQAILETFNKSGPEPEVGDFYYFSAKYAKTEYPISIYTQLKDVVSAIGDVNTDNRLSLAAYLAFSNGAIAIALAQVLRDNTGVDASVQSYKDILTQIESPLRDTGIKPSLVCPVTSNQEVINATRLHCEKVSTIRYKSERTTVFGYAVGTTPEQAQSFARNMKSERMIGLYPDGAIVGLIDELGNVNEAVVDGSLLAAAFAGLVVNPIYDVATPLTHKKLIGFRRLVQQLDAVTMNQTAVAGLTIVEDLSPDILIRQAMTTNIDTVLTREPTVVFIKDYVQQQMRNTLDKFIGIKFLSTVLQDAETSVDNLMNQLINQEIITQFQGTSAIQDENDPTIMRIESFYSPVFPLNWIVVTLNLRVSL